MTKTEEITFSLEHAIDVAARRWSDRNKLMQMVQADVNANILEALKAEPIHKEQRTQCRMTYRHRNLFLTRPTEDVYEITVGGNPALDQRAIAPVELEEKLLLTLYAIRTEHEQTSKQ
uniref:hypothetical protein n=1 Tax=Trichocoleus desertorum TaxID=1481672 RepID=UPI0025B612C2|nr:hypothetical protein [Trichocoleus desertorum]